MRHYPITSSSCKVLLRRRQKSPKFLGWIQVNFPYFGQFCLRRDKLLRLMAKAKGCFLFFFGEIANQLKLWTEAPNRLGPPRRIFAWFCGCNVLAKECGRNLMEEKHGIDRLGSVFFEIAFVGFAFFFVFFFFFFFILFLFLFFVFFVFVFLCLFVGKHTRTHAHFQWENKKN